MRLIFLVALLLSLFSTHLVYAQDATTATSKVTTTLTDKSDKEQTTLARSSLTSAQGLSQWAGTTILILAIIFLIAYFLKKTKLVRVGSKNMRIIGQLALGPKERIMHVEVNGEELLLGVTPQSINLITRLGEERFSSEIKAIYGLNDSNRNISSEVLSDDNNNSERTAQAKD